ncbi:MAG: hypothetical protein JWO38_6499 [Gemmataceae bacterium]|nr:hypothetical protein [Gemmataceae bacterium]
MWREVLGTDYRMIDRLTRIYFRRRFFHYPLRPVDALRNMGLVDAARCVASYLREKVSPSFRGDELGTFEAWVVRRFGRRLFEMFFKSYSEKLWGIPCHDLDADFAAQRIKKFSLGEAIKSALGVGGRHKTLVNHFAYPLGGTGLVYERMADRVRAAGNTVHLRAPVRRVVHEGFRVRGLELADGRVEPFDHVISTTPLTHLVGGLKDVPLRVRTAAAGLRYRNTILVYLHVGGRDLFSDQWLYVHSPDLRVGRVTNFRTGLPGRPAGGADRAGRRERSGAELAPAPDNSGADVSARGGPDRGGVRRMGPAGPTGGRRESGAGRRLSPDRVNRPRSDQFPAELHLTLAQRAGPNRREEVGQIRSSESSQLSNSANAFTSKYSLPVSFTTR